MHNHQYNWAKTLPSGDAKVNLRQRHARYFDNKENIDPSGYNVRRKSEIVLADQRRNSYHQPTRTQSSNPLSTKKENPVIRKKCYSSQDLFFSRMGYLENDFHLERSSSCDSVESCWSILSKAKTLESTFAEPPSSSRRLSDDAPSSYRLMSQRNKERFTPVNAKQAVSPCKRPLGGDSANISNEEFVEASSCPNIAVSCAKRRRIERTFAPSFSRLPTCVEEPTSEDNNCHDNGYHSESTPHNNDKNPFETSLVSHVKASCVLSSPGNRPSNDDITSLVYSTSSSSSDEEESFIFRPKPRRNTESGGPKGECHQQRASTSSTE